MTFFIDDSAPMEQFGEQFGAPFGTQADTFEDSPQPNRSTSALAQNSPSLLHSLQTLTQLWQETLTEPTVRQRAESQRFLAEFRTELENRLRQRAGTNPNANLIAMVQTNPSPADLRGNAHQILGALSLAESLGVGWLLFPELSLMGYPARDLISRHPFLVADNIRWLKAIAKQTGHTRVVVGFVEPRFPQDLGLFNDPSGWLQSPGWANPPSAGKPYYNSVAVLHRGRIEAVVRKSLLPTYGEYEDHRTFEASEQVGVQPPPAWLQPPQEGHTDTSSLEGPLLVANGLRYGLTICEDIWNDASFLDRPLHHHDPVSTLVAAGADVILNLSASVSRARKESLKHHMLSHIAQRHQKPLVYVNQVGTVDECSFDGGSRCYNAQGTLIARAPLFETAFWLCCPGETPPEPSPGVAKKAETLVSPPVVSPLVVSPLEPICAIAPLPGDKQPELPPLAIKQFDPSHQKDLARTYASLLQGIGDYFKKTGFQRAVLGLSGGIDSAVVATLLADALGGDAVLAVSMPTHITPEINRVEAKTLADNLGIHFVETPIQPMVNAGLSALQSLHPTIAPQWGSTDPRSFSADNIQAMSRATLLRLLGNDYRALPIATSDKSEFYMGYTTVNGDMSGALAPLGDVPKTKVRALARWINLHTVPQERIPLGVIERPSGADLALDPDTGKPLTAEAALMPYAFADEIIWRLETLHQSKQQMQQETFYWETCHGALSAEQKRVWLDRFFQRMSASVFKWWLAPPTLLVSGSGSVTKTDYHHPITAARIRWEGYTPADIEAILSVWSMPATAGR
ncbi:MAG: NAD(+) synthase [Candidatus Melainabacteria bacterium]|nr:NAD(+) synthase [Candidatus Melainabacteria bacterium]